MDIKAILDDKSRKPKEKTEEISNALISGSLKIADLISFAESAKEAGKATCIEAVEFATQKNAELVNKKAFGFFVSSLADKAPRVKWESAKVIGNTAKLFKADLNEAVKNLLDNSEHTGTVVRWSAAFALGEIVKLKTLLNKNLIPAIKSTIEREEKNSIKKIYLAALKKIE